MTHHAPLPSVPAPGTPLLEIHDLRTDITLRHSVVRAVDGVDLALMPGEALGLVGESGCGKTMTALSVMRLLPAGGSIVGGSIRLHGVDLTGLDEDAMRRIRGNDLGMVFQDPLTSLNPTMTVGRQLEEAVLLHRDVTHAVARARAAEVLDLVGIAQAHSRLDDYPHQFSGGMRQRVVIAMALVCDPQLLIADEPTTALDVTIQAQILELVDGLRRDLGMAVILVTHDLGVVAGRTDQVAVMYAGRIVETCPTDLLFDSPRHRYTEALLQALPERAVETADRLYSIPGIPPDLSRPLTGCRFAERCEFAEDDCRAIEPALRLLGDAHAAACLHPVTARRELVVESVGVGAAPRRTPEALLEVEHLTKDFPVGGSFLSRRRGTVSAVADVSFSVPKGRTLGLVGESGCGKTTTARLVVGIERADAGRVLIGGQELGATRGEARRTLRRSVQYMFQDPYSSLDPRMRVGAILREPLQIQRIGDRASRRRRVTELLDTVGLPRSAVDRYPHEFSGGQRQRIGLARALALSPELVVADEPVSALDVSVQAQILNAMRELQSDLGLTYVVISHDLAVVRYLSDRMGVMYLGKLVEEGPAPDVYHHPLHPYTHALIETVPVADPVRERAKSGTPLHGELPSAADPPNGCRFRTRCPLATDLCATEEPHMRELREGHRVACHFPLERPQLRPVGQGSSA
jgi:peptide/nickel transport system ATP-binding protein